MDHVLPGGLGLTVRVGVVEAHHLPARFFGLLFNADEVQWVHGKLGPLLVRPCVVLGGDHLADPSLPGGSPAQQDPAALQGVGMDGVGANPVQGVILKDKHGFFSPIQSRSKPRKPEAFTETKFHKNLRFSGQLFAWMCGKRMGGCRVFYFLFS